MITYIICEGKFIFQRLRRVDKNSGSGYCWGDVLTCDNARRIWGFAGVSSSTPQNRTTTNWCLVVFDVFFLLPVPHYVSVFSNYYGRGFSPAATPLLRDIL